MSSMTANPHLTDDQIDDALIGDLAEDCAAHLAACDQCQLRLAEAEAPIVSFNAVSLAWSERQSATMPRPATSGNAGWLPRALWAATAAAVLAVGIAVPVMRHSPAENAETSVHSSAAVPTLMASTGPVDNPVAARDEQIAHDNQMLEKINRELTPTSSLDQDYGLQSVSGQMAAHAGSGSIRN